MLDANLPGAYPQIGQFHIGTLASGAGLEIDCEGNLWAVDQSNETVYQAESGESASLCSPDTVPWFAEVPITGTVAASDSLGIDIGWWANVSEVDQPGVYHAGLKIKNNDPANQGLALPVTMTVTPPPTWGRLAGIVSSTGHCDVNPHPIEGAQVYLEGSGGYTFTLETGSGGDYQRWLDAAESPYTVTVSYPEHPTTTVAVTIAAGVTTTRDFTLRWQQPCVSVTVPPPGISATLDMGISATLPISIGNSGAVSLDFEFQERDRGFQIASLVLGVAPKPKPRERYDSYDPNATTTEGIMSPGGSEPLSILAAGDVLNQWPSGLALNWGAAYDGDDDTVWLSNLGAGGGDDLDHEFQTDGAATGRTIDTTPWIGSWAGDMAYNPNTGMIWQVNVGGDNCIYELDPTTGAATGNSICDPAWTWTSQRGLAYDPTTDTFFIGGWNDTNVYQIRGLSGASPGAVVQQWALGLSVSGLAYHHDAGQLFIIENSTTDTISQFDVASGAIVNSFTVAGFGYAGAGLGINCDGNLWAANQGDNNAYLIDSGVPGSLCATDVPWLFEDPITGTVPADGGLAPIDVTLDAAYVAQPGEYYATLNVKSNDPVNSRVGIPVTMTVNVPATWGKLQGTVTSLGHCDANPAPLEDAEVLAENGTIISLTTDVSGTYVLWLDQGTYTVTISEADHLTDIAVVNVTAGTTTTQDFALRWLRPCVSVTAPPDGISATLDMGISTTMPISIGNSGATSLEFEFAERDGGFTPLAWGNILLVDDDSGGSYDARPYFEAALTSLGMAYDILDTGGGNGPLSAQMTSYDVVVWFSGDTWGGTAGPNSTDEIELATYLDGGGSLFLASQDYYYDMGLTPFMQMYLGLDSATSDVGHTSVTGVPGDPIGGGFGTLSLSYPGFNYSDNLTPDGTASAAFSGSAGNYAAIDKENDYQTVFFGFPWEALQNSNPSDGEAVIQAILDWLAPADVPWLFEDPISGTVAADTGFQLVDVILDAAYVAQPGEYYATLNVNSDDPVDNRIGIPVTMTVNLPDTYGKLQGTVTSLGYCDVNTTTLEGAQVSIEGGLITPTTDVSGTYVIWLEQGTYTVTVSAADHVSDTAVVAVTTQMTTTQDFTLRSIQPCLSVAPLFMESVLSPGESETQTLMLINTGAGASLFEFREITRTVASLSIGVVGSGSNWASTLNADPELSSRYTFVDLGNDWTYATIQSYVGIVVNESDYGLTTGETDALRQYYDAGGAILMGMDDVDDEGTTEQTDVYYTFGVTNAVDGNFYVGTLNPAHPIAQGVTLADMGADNDHFDEDGATWVVRGSDGYDYVLARDDSARTVIFGEQLSQWWNNNNRQLIRNAIEWATQTDVPWLAEDPVTGTVGAGSVFDVDVVFTAFPTMTFGTYTATLMVNTDDVVNNPISVPVTMTVSAAPACGFTSSSPDDLGETTTFTNTTTGATPITYNWDFGDDGGISASENPTYTYAHVGFYTVVLTATNAYGGDVCTDTVSIEGPPEASFVSNSPVVLSDPMVFTNTTFANPAVTGWFWMFGSGEGTSTDENPTYTYANPGSYLVTLIATNVKGGDLYTDTVTVLEPPTTYTLTVNVEGSGTVTPTGGTYISGTMVTLIAAANTGSVFAGWSGDVTGSSETITTTMTADKTITATFVISCTGVTSASFDYNPSDPEENEAITFTALYTPSIASIPTITWNFGSGVIKNGASVTHTYAVSNTYWITLAVSNECTSPAVEYVGSVRVVESSRYIYLPLVMRSYP